MKLKVNIYKILLIVIIGMSCFFVGKTYWRQWMFERRLDELIKKDKLIEKQIVVGVTTRLEFEKLFDAQLAGGISNQDCRVNEYCQENILSVGVEFDDDSSRLSCNPNAIIVKPIVINRTHYACL